MAWDFSTEPEFEEHLAELRRRQQIMGDYVRGVARHYATGRDGAPRTFALAIGAAIIWFVAGVALMAAAAFGWWPGRPRDAQAT